MNGFAVINDIHFYFLIRLHLNEELWYIKRKKYEIYIFSLMLWLKFLLYVFQDNVYNFYITETLENAIVILLI